MKSDIENKEWPDDYMSLKQVSPANPFTVPEGYFDGLEEQIVSSIRLNELVPSSSQPFAVPENYFEELNTNIISRINIEEALKGSEQGFTVPQNYFEELAENITARISIEETLQEREPGFTVPQNYFEELADNITARVNVEEALKGNEEAFTVPEGYFENMEQQIMSRIAVEEAITAENPFTVPEHYFEQLHTNIMDQAKQLDAIKRKGVVRKLISSAAFKYASAACFALVIGAVVFIAEINSPKAVHDRTYLHKALSNIPDNTIESYLDLHMDNSDTRILMDKADQGHAGLEHVSTDDLKDYLSDN